MERQSVPQPLGFLRDREARVAERRGSGRSFRGQGLGAELSFAVARPVASGRELCRAAGLSQH